MALENKLGLTSSADLAREEERISKKRARELGKVVDWSQVDKEDYLPAMERSPIRDIEIKHILRAALTDDVNSREVYMKGIDHSYYYEGYTAFKAEEL